jgi:hypothetical protein
MEIIGKLVVAAIDYTTARSPDPLSVLRSPVLWGMAGIVLGVWLFFRGFPLLKRKSLVQDIPTSTVRSASLGCVEVSGKVVGPYTLIAPLSESDCFFYQAVVGGSGEEGKATTKSETLYVPFFLDDGTGRLMVDPRGAEIELPSSIEEEYSPSTATACTRHFLNRHGISGADPANLEEYCIRESDLLFVLGTLRENPGLSAAQVSRSAPGEVPAGFLSSAAADLQRRAVIESMYPPGTALPPTPLQESLKATPFDLNPPILLTKGTSGQPFFISRRSQREVVQSLAWRSTLYIWGGPILALTGLWLLLARLLQL